MLSGRPRRGGRRARRGGVLPRGAPDARRVPAQAAAAVRAGQRGGGRGAQRARRRGREGRATAWPPAACSAAFAEVAAAPEFLTFPLSDELDYAQGAGLILNYHTAWFSLQAARPARRGRDRAGARRRRRRGHGLDPGGQGPRRADDRRGVERRQGGGGPRRRRRRGGALRRPVEGRGQGALRRRRGRGASTPWAATASPTACARSREGGRVVVVGFTGGSIPEVQGQPAAAEQHRGGRAPAGAPT